MSKTRSLFILIICGVLAAPALAQSGRRPQPGSDQTKDDPIRLRADEVLLNITVTDSYGRHATDLLKNEFIISEDGQRQDVSSFLVSAVPVHVVLMLDASGSVAGDISSIKEAALGFVAELKPEDKVSVISFHTHVDLLQDWTSKPDDLRHAISWKFKPGMIRTKEGHAQYGLTSLYDALYLTAEEQLAKVEGRKAIIILTDGDDSSSKVTFKQALASVIRSNSVVYVVSKAQYFINEIKRNYGGRLNSVFNGANARLAGHYITRLEQAERLMTDLSGRTGGRLFSPLRSDEMKSVYSQVARELKNQYIITYTPKNEERDGKLRRINVYLTRAGYSARTRDSYYAPKPQD